MQECEDKEIDELPESEWVKMTTMLFISIKKQVIKMKKSIHYVDTRFCKEIQTLNRNIGNEEFNVPNQK